MRKAFTLIELIMVIVIIGIMSAVVMPAFVNSYNYLKIESAYRQLIQDIRYAQQLSITRQQRHGVYIASTGNSYSVYRQTTDETVIDPATRKQLSVFFGEVGNSNTIMLSSTYGLPGGVEFGSLGTPYSTGGGSSSGGTITLTFKGTNKSISIEVNTGRIS